MQHFSYVTFNYKTDLGKYQGTFCFPIWYIILYKLYSFIEVNLIGCMQSSCRRLTALPHDGDFFWEKSPTPILDMVDTPVNLKNLSIQVFEAHKTILLKF